MSAPGETPNPRNREPAPGGAGSQRQPPSKPARFKRAPPPDATLQIGRCFPYIDANAPPPADLSTGARAWRHKARLGVTGLPPKGNLVSLALLMASTIAHSLALVKRASASKAEQASFQKKTRQAQQDSTKKLSPFSQLRTTILEGQPACEFCFAGFQQS